AEKEAETNAAALGWVSEVRGIQRGLFTDLRRIADDPENPSLRTKADGVLADKKEQRLRLMNLGVTCMIIGVGVCLMLGLFTRLASLAGAGFLLSVMATQPPWVEGANMMFFYYQLVEFAALTVLFATAAGRIAGLDYIISALWNQRSDRKGA
ncbi:MAG: DoxX family protein, partial [Planctomycetota bacterium]